MTRENTPANYDDEDTPFEIEETAALPAPDTLFRALSTTIRRRTLWYLLEEPETTAETLADVLAGWQSTTDGIVGPREREQISIELRHAHLPVLSSAGLIEYDSETGAIRAAETPHAVRELIRYACQYDRAIESDQ